jgi:hypothetical protein
MVLRRNPRPPSVADFLVFSPSGVPRDWVPYLETAVA